MRGSEIPLRKWSGGVAHLRGSIACKQSSISCKMHY